MEYTKFVDKLPLSTDSLYAMFKSKIFDRILESELSGFHKEVEHDVGLIHDYFAKYEWIPMRIGTTSNMVLFNTKASIFIPDLLTFKFDVHKRVTEDYSLGFYNFSAKLFKKGILEAISFKSIEDVYLLNTEYSRKKDTGKDFVDIVHEINPSFNNYLAYSDPDAASQTRVGTTLFDIREKNFASGRIRSDFSVMPMVRVACTNAASLLQSLRELKLTVTPYGGKFGDLKTALDHISRSFMAGLITDDFHINYGKISNDLRNKGSLSEFNINYNTITSRGYSAGVIDSLDADSIAKPLLEVEHERADIDPYDSNILIDPNRGHWDLWNKDEAKG